MTFEEWAAPLRYAATLRDAYLAGQASAEQRVKWQDDLIQELQAKCAELERERDQWKYTAEIRQQHLEYTIKAQAGEHIRRWNIEPDGDDLLICDGNHDKHEKCEYIRYTPASTVKAQAGEPVGYHFSYTTPFGHVVWAIDYTPRPDAIEVYPLVRAHPTTERPYNPLNDYAVIPMTPTTEPVKAQAGEHEEFECPRCSATMVVHPHQTPAKTLIDPEPAYAALLSAKVALCAVNSGASIKAIAEIDSILNATPAPTKEMK